VPSLPDADTGGDIPERESDDAAPVFLLHNHVPTRDGMIPRMPPLRLRDSFAVSCKARAGVF
jgi:hypothetical protein